MTLDYLHAFANELKKKFALPGSANPEDQLKSAVASLIGAPCATSSRRLS